MRKAVLAATGIAATLAMGTAAGAATAGAMQGAATQGGNWGASGWQPGPDAMPPQPDMPGPGYGDAMAPGMQPYRPMPPSGDYRPVHPGQKLAPKWRDPALTVRDWREWGLGRPDAGMHWIRYYDDAVLLDADARVVAVDPGIDWDVPHTRTGPGGSYAAGGPPGGPGMPPPPGWGPPARPPLPYGTSVAYPAPGTTVTTQVIAPALPAGYGYGYGATIVSPTVITTTTTTTEQTVWHSVSRARRPIHRSKLVRR